MKVPKSIKDKIKLYNGVEIPCLGFGTFQTPDGEQTVQAVKAALDAGYRLIDTAAVYGNERGVGEAVQQSGVPREEIFVTTKVWNSDQGYEKTLRAFDGSMKKLNLDYLDLYLIHWPVVKGHKDDWQRLNRETWQAMERLYEDGRIKAIGVCNFQPKHIASLMELSLTLPMINQIELHPGWTQPDTVDFCKQNNIVIEAWGPFSRGNLFGSGLLEDMAAKYGKSVAQLTLRWHLQMGFLPLPKSVTPHRIEENTRIFDFHISDSDMEYITSVKDTGTGKEPDKVAY